LVEIFPFVKFCWRSKEIQSKWQPLKTRIYTAVHFAEYEMVKRGYRKCDVYDFGPGNIVPRLRKVASDGLIFIPILISQQYGGYGHKHYVVNNFTDDTFIYGGVARNKDDAIRFHDAGVVNLSERIRDWSDMNPNGIDHDITGELLGYPKCDRDFFKYTWLRDGCVDPMFEMALNTENHERVSKQKVKVSGNPLLNRLCRYWGYNIIPFFPHSFDCAEALKFADKFYGLMREYDEEAVEACYEVLSMPMMWTLNNCIIEVQHPLFWGSANGYYRPEKVTVEWFPE
jgi:hypothetical protein